MFKKFPIGLKENLQEEDNFSTRDNWPVPNVSFVRRFHCIHIFEDLRLPNCNCNLDTPKEEQERTYTIHA